METGATKANSANGPTNANSSLLGEAGRGDQVFDGGHWRKHYGPIDPGPTLLERINELIEQHGNSIAHLAKLKEAQPEHILRMRVRELQALAYLESPF